MFDDEKDESLEQQEAVNSSLDSQFGLNEQDDPRQQLQKQVTQKQNREHKPLSKEEYVEKHGTEEGYKDPEEWTAYGKAYDEVKELISGLKQAVHDRDNKIDKLIAYNDRIEERVRERTLREIDVELRRAKENMDVDAVEKLTHARTQAIQEQALAAQVAVQQESTNALQSFQERNKHWYGSNQAMMARLQQLDKEQQEECNQTGVRIPMDKYAKMLELKLKAEFPEVMLSPNAGGSAPVVSSARSNMNRSGNVDSVDVAFSKLSNDHKTLYEAYRDMSKRNGWRKGQPLSKQDFLNKLKKDGEI